jgi:hypothetical protein
MSGRPVASSSRVRGTKTEVLGEAGPSDPPLEGSRPRDPAARYLRQNLDHENLSFVATIG